MVRSHFPTHALLVFPDSLRHPPTEEAVKSTPKQSAGAGKTRFAQTGCPPISRLLFLRLVGLLKVALLGKTSPRNKHSFRRLFILFEMAYRSIL